MLKPYVRVLIDTYNHERLIEQAITSMLDQNTSMLDVEIIEVDDGSTDRTPEIVRKFEPRVRLIRKPNGVQASAFNAGIPECHGEIIAFLDGDDCWAPEKLRRVVEEMECDPKVGFVGAGIMEDFPGGREHTESLREMLRFRLDSTEGARIFRVRKAFLGTSRMTIRAGFVPDLLPVPEQLWFETDEYLFTLAALAKISILPEALTFYRIHASNLYQMCGCHEDAMRQKQHVLAYLANELAHQLRECGLAAAAVDIVTEALVAEADQLRFMVDGSYPQEMVRTEVAMYRIICEKVSLGQCVFKCASLLPGLVLPLRLFYHARRWVAATKFYLRARKSLLPIPQLQHTVRHWKENL